MNPEFLIVIEFIAFAAIGYSITRIKNIKLRNISFTIFVIAQIICMIILGFKASKYQREKRIANFEEKVGDIYFQGKVISSFTKYIGYPFLSTSFAQPVPSSNPIFL